MGRGIGLKLLIALHLVVLLGMTGVLLGYAAARLLRHGLLEQQAVLAKSLLEYSSRHLRRVCPWMVSRHRCSNLSDLRKENPGQVEGWIAIWILDARGILVASTDPKQISADLWDAFGTGDPITSGERDWQVVERHGRRLLVAHVDLEEPSWRMGGLFPLKRVDGLIERNNRSLVLYMFLVMGVIGLLGWLLLVRMVAKPVEKLLQTAYRISEGDLDFLTAADGGSEFGRLGWSFSRMAQRIEEDQSKLKKQIKELTRLNRELNQAQQGLIRTEKLASVGRLAAGLAHEVGNPISAILGYVGMMRTEKIPAKQRRDMLMRVEKEVERIDKIIKDLLAYSRPGRGLVKSVAPDELLEDAMVLIRPQKKYKQVGFQLMVSLDLPKVRADPEIIRQVLVNLMLNALDALQEGGHIWVRATAMAMDADRNIIWPGCQGEPNFFQQGKLHIIRPPHGGRGLKANREVVVFSISDDGQGIQPGNLSRLFDPFFTTKDPGKGTGLGLAICHAGVTAMGGEIWVWSKPGEGTQFSFYLPVAAAGEPTPKETLSDASIHTENPS